MSLIPQSTQLQELTRIFNEIERRLKGQKPYQTGVPSSDTLVSQVGGAGAGASPGFLPPSSPTPSSADLAAINATLASLAANLLTKAPLLSPSLVGIPTVPTAAINTNTQQAASTAFMLAQLDTDPRLARKIPFTLANGTAVFLSGSSGGIPFTKADGTLSTLFLVAG